MFTVLTTVYRNDRPNEFDQSLESLYNQTLPPGQIVLVVDGQVSSELVRVISKWKHKFANCLDVIQLQCNLGLAEALNVGLKHAKFELIARHDSDDFSFKHRFEIQIDLMMKDISIDVLGAQVIEGPTIDVATYKRHLPVSHNQIINTMWIRNPINHPTVVYRKSSVLKCGAYDARYGDDDHLWSKLAASGAKFENLPIPLVYLRRDDSVHDRRGTKWLRGDIEVRKVLYGAGLITPAKFITSICVYSIYRAIPPFGKKLLYKLLTLRKK